MARTEIAPSDGGMLTVSGISGSIVYVPKRGRKGASGTFSRLGKVHLVVFSPKGDYVVGILVKRPDIVGMVKREDSFVALDAVKLCDGGLMVTRPDDGMDDEARSRLGLAWDDCIIWTGMDAQTTEGKQLGFVTDAEFALDGGRVKAFLVGDGGMASTLVGSIAVPPSMVRGYRKGSMVVDAKVAKLELTGGLAAKAGVGYAKAKVAGKQAAERAKAEGAKAAATAGKMAGEAGKAAGEAIDKGSRAFGRHLGKTKGMFGAFIDEYKKASE